MQYSSSLGALGWTEFFEEQFRELDDRTLVPMRVAIEHQDRYTVVGASHTQDAHLTGKLLQDANRGGPRPAAGDWIALTRDGPICHLFRRHTAFQRVSPRGKLQVISANIDRVLIVTSCNAEFNVRRIERYLSAVSQSGAQAALVLTKIDLCSDSSIYREKLQAVAGTTPMLLVATPSGQGISALEPLLGPGISLALVGSSGVGKSTLANALMGEERFVTAAIREQDGKGRHTTTRRELVLLSGNRGVLIDTPGMRQLQLSADPDEGQRAFEDIVQLSRECQFRNCAHRSEPGCAVRGKIASERLRNYQTIVAETRVSQRLQKSTQRAVHKADPSRAAKKARKK